MDVGNCGTRGADQECMVTHYNGCKTPVPSSTITSTPTGIRQAANQAKLWLDTNFSSQAMEAYPTRKAINVPTASWPPLAAWPAAGSKTSASEKIPEARTAGIASRKLNRVATSRSRLRNRPAKVVPPDRVTTEINDREGAKSRSSDARQG